MERFRTLEEGQARGTVKETYLEIERLLGTPFVSALFRSLALHPDEFQSFWTKLKPNLETQNFIEFASQLRTQADDLAEATFELPDLYSWLQGHNFSREDIRHILYTLEAMHYTNPKILLATAALTASALNISDSRANRQTASRITSTEPEFPDKIHRVMFEQAPHDVKEVYLDVAETMGSPLVPDDFAVFGPWPTFLRKLWTELKPSMRSTTFLDEAQAVSALAIERAQELPFDIDLTNPGLEISRILEVFLSLSARTMVGTAGLRNAVLNGEQLARITGRAAGESDPST